MSRRGIVLIGSGPSVEGFDLQSIPATLPVLAINTAALKVPRYNYFFSLDPSPVVDSILRDPPDHGWGAKYFMAVDRDFATPYCSTLSHRKMQRYSHVTYLERVRGSGPFSSCYGLSTRAGYIHTGNSMYGALGWAYLNGFNEIAILGLDAKQGRRWCDDGRTGSLAHLPELFASAVSQLNNSGINVYNGSPDSAVICFPRCSPECAVQQLKIATGEL